tara:strand:- start:46 stop:351 length:306 start_codon:yes stop_codon:yes gene_type:complete
MDIKKFFSINNLKNKDLFDIRSFIIVFSIYSIISIWSADSVYKKAIVIKQLKEELQLLKSQHISTRTALMTSTKYSYLLKKGATFGLFEPEEPLKTLYLLK